MTGPARGAGERAPAGIPGLGDVRLDCGLRLLSWPMPGVQTVAVALAVPAGARHEAEREHGLAHLFEHMLFKGTATRSARQIAEAIEDVGGDLNAWTSREMTMVHARTLADHLPVALDIIADIVAESRLAEADLALERGVVLAEIGESRDDPEDCAYDLAQHLSYPGQALGRAILGTPDSIDALDEAALQRWRELHWSLDGAVLAVAGALEPARLAELCNRRFGKQPGGRPPASGHAVFRGGAGHLRRRIEQQVSVLAFEAPGRHAPDRAAAALFAAAVGGGMSSRLFQEIREERGLAYAVDASHCAYAETGQLLLHAATRPADARGTVARLEEVARKAAADLSDAELARARAQAKAGLLMGLEGCAGAADWAARTCLTHGAVLVPAAVVAELDAVTLDEVRAAGSAMLSGRTAFATVGPARIADPLAP